jgi:hypothetical protein
MTTSARPPNSSAARDHVLGRVRLCILVVFITWCLFPFLAVFTNTNTNRGGLFGAVLEVM